MKAFLVIGITTFCLSFLLQLVSCKDDIAWSDDNTYTIAGHLYTDCNLEPVKNFKMRLIIDHPNGPYGTDYDMTVESTTDSNGYYKFEFKNKRDYPLVIEYSAGAGFNTLMSAIPAKTSLNDLSLHMNPSTNITVGINVNKPYTASDTLFIADFRTNKYLAIPGPFTSGTIYTAVNFGLFEENYIGEKRDLIWYMNHFSGTNNEKWFTIDKYCKDTVFVYAEIN